MLRYGPARCILQFCIMVPLVLLMACSSAPQVRLPMNMVPFKDTAKNMEFMLPSGWEQASVDPMIEKITSRISDGVPVGFRKGDKGTLAVWCDRYDPARARIVHMMDVIKEYSPLSNKTVSIQEVESPGSGFLSRPSVYGTKATEVVKGEKTGFLIVTVEKGLPLSKTLRGCEYMLFSRSATDEYSEEIKEDILAIAATLKN